MCNCKKIGQRKTNYVTNTIPPIISYRLKAQELSVYRCQGNLTLQLRKVLIQMAQYVRLSGDNAGNVGCRFCI